VSVETVKIFVNLEKERATVQIIRRYKLFDNPAKRFLIEEDAGGFSCIEKRDDGYHSVIYLRERDILGRWDYSKKPTPIEDRKLTPKEVKETIREVLRVRHE